MSLHSVVPESKDVLDRSSAESSLLEADDWNKGTADWTAKRTEYFQSVDLFRDVGINIFHANVVSMGAHLSSIVSNAAGRNRSEGQGSTYGGRIHSRMRI
jgi:hypothetical protein